MSIKAKLNRLASSDWLVAFGLLIIFLLTNGYIYGWDDQHVEIPLLKRLIDPTLYPHDYYVESLVQNFPSYFFHLLAKFITTEQIPAVYFLLYLVSRYFLFFWIYKIWLFISKDRGSAFICGLTFILIGRVEEFLYRTFSHQEFALAIVMAGMYFFYRDRFFLAAAIWGISANIHAVYSLFPALYLGAYFLGKGGRESWAKLAKSAVIFMICALPVLWRIVQKFQTTALPPESPLLVNWLSLYKIACPQNFVFLDIPLEHIFKDLRTFLSAMSKFLYLGGLYVLNFSFNRAFRDDKKAQSIALTTVILLGVSFIFTYVLPSRFILDLNLVRTTQFLLFILVGYTTLLLVAKIEKEKFSIAVLIGLMFALLRFADIIAFLAVLFLCVLFLWTEKSLAPRSQHFLLFAFGLISAGIIASLVLGEYSPSSKLLVVVVLGLLGLLGALRPRQRKLFLLVPLTVVFLSFCFFHLRYLQIVKGGSGLWQLQRNWEDMQRFVKKNTPKNALIFVPHDMEMGGFRISSERTILVCYRDCGIIGFDFQAAREWENRLQDVGSFQVYIQTPPETAIINALRKYRVNYIVFMNYAVPKEAVPFLEKIYSNEVFTLYRVTINPVE